jgi:ATP-dependent protease ClpP protease subunit
MSAEEALDYGIVDRVMLRVHTEHGETKLGSVEA